MIVTVTVSVIVIVTVAVARVTGFRWREGVIETSSWRPGGQGMSLGSPIDLVTAGGREARGSRRRLPGCRMRLVDDAFTSSWCEARAPVLSRSALRHAQGRIDCRLRQVSFASDFWSSHLPRGAQPPKSGLHTRSGCRQDCSGENAITLHAGLW